MPTTNNAIKFKSGLRANYDAIETKDLDTLYFCTDTMELFLGDDEYTKVTEKLTAAPTSGAAGTGTAGEHGKLYFYNSNLYLCEVTGGTTPTYTWTTVANINTKNGTVTSVTLKVGDGLSIDSTSAITSTGTRTISHAVPSGAAASTTSPNSAQTPAFNATFNIPTITTDEFGHVTGKGTTTVKIPAQTTLSKGTDTSGTATTLTFGGTFTAMTDTSVSNHTITDQNTTFTMPDISAASSGTGNVVTSITASNGVVTANKGSTAVLTSGAQTVAGVKTFSSFPVTPSSAPTTDYQTANKKYVDDKVSAGFAANDAMIFKGTIGTGGTVTALPTTGYSAGWTYRIITAGTYAGVTCEVGDMVVCVKDYATTAANSDWSVVQTNIDGAVTHSTNFTSGQVIVADGTSGVKTTGYTIATSVPSGAKFTDTTYSVMTGATSSTAGTSGLVPAPASGKQASFLRGDGTWVVPTNTTYSNATTSTAGLMSAADKTKSDATNIAYGTCDTAATTAEKIVTITANDNWVLNAGSIITVKFTYTNTASNPTLNVNGTGAKSIYYSNAVITTSNLTNAGSANRYLRYMYDGTNYVWIGWSVDNMVSSPMQLGCGYGTCSTAAATVAKVATLSSYSLVTGGIVAVKFTYDVPASATLNINSKGAKSIYYRGAAITAGIIKAGDIVTFIYSSQYHVISIDRDFVDDSERSVGSADKLTTGRTIALTGGVTGTSAAWDGSANLSIATTLANHASNKVTSLTGYAVATSYSAITTSDSLNTALGKLQLGVTQAKSAATDAKLVWGSF